MGLTVKYSMSIDFVPRNRISIFIGIFSEILITWMIVSV